MIRRHPRLAALGTGLARLEDGLLVGLLLGLLGLAVSQILLRNLFNGGLTWADPLLRTGVLWLAMLGAAIAARRHHHISIDLLTRGLGGLARRLLLRLIFSLTALLCAWVAWHCGRFVLIEYEYPSPWILGLESWVPPLVLPLGFGLIALRYAAHALGLTDPEA